MQITNTINVLPDNEIKYVKTISFDVVMFNQAYSGKIIYMRNPSPSYRMDDSKRTEFQRQLFYYPESCYPSDILDDIIFEGVKAKYPGARVSSKLMLCDCDKELLMRKLKIWARESFTIYIQPKIDDIDAILSSGKTQWRVFNKQLPLYLTNTRDTQLFKNEAAFLYYDLGKERELIELEDELLNDVITDL